MRQSLNEVIAQQSNKRLFSVDFHDFIQKEMILNDVEMAQEFQLSIREVRELRRKMKR